MKREAYRVPVRSVQVAGAVTLVVTKSPMAALQLCHSQLISQSLLYHPRELRILTP